MRPGLCKVQQLYALQKKFRELQDISVQWDWLDMKSSSLVLSFSLRCLIRLLAWPTALLLALPSARYYALGQHLLPAVTHVSFDSLRTWVGGRRVELSAEQAHPLVRDVLSALSET